tara:strand:+ start:1250 stop:2233 length:984 start_codon:yes stop_codon:yes gene_type:complete
MIDGDDRDENSRDVEGAPVEESQESSEVEHGSEAGEGSGGAPAQDQPVMDLEGGSDEGGTIETAREDPADEPETTEEADATPQAEPVSEHETEDDAALDEDDDGQAFEGEDLGLVSDDDALPWLESSDYEEIESVDAWRVTGFVVLGLVVLALLVGGIWYVVNRNDDGQPLADGSTIAAPEGPFKERPEDPGGKTFEGTGDMAPAVGEGESREGRLADKPATPEPVAKTTEKPAEKAASEPAKTPAAKDNRIAVQVGAYRDEATAKAGWRQLSRQTDALSGVEYRIVKGEADIGTVYRLQALPGDMAAARRLAAALKADGVASQIKR